MIRLYTLRLEGRLYGTLAVVLGAGAAALPAQTFGTIRGSVLDSATGQPVSGALISLTQRAVVGKTDASGTFTVKAPLGPVTVYASRFGYEARNQIVIVDSAREARADFHLPFRPPVLSEVVVTGYVGRDTNPGGTLYLNAQNSTLFASVAAVDARHVVQTSTIRLRGSSALAKSAEPLIVIDGVPLGRSSSDSVSALQGAFGLSDIDPADIQSIQVLRGASAVTLYGSSAAGGVVSIVTKGDRSGPQSAAARRRRRLAEDFPILPVVAETAAVGAEAEGDPTCLKTGSPYAEGRYHVLNNCVIHFRFGASEEARQKVEKFVVVLSKDNVVTVGRDVTLLDLKPDVGDTIEFRAASRIAGEGEYIIAQVTLDDERYITALQFSFKVRAAPFYWQKLALGAALSFNKPQGSDSYQVTPSPMLFSGLGWGYRSAYKNYVFPRSLGILVNPDAVGARDGSDAQTQVTLGIGTSLIDDNVGVGVAWEGGNRWRPRYVISWKATVFEPN